MNLSITPQISPIFQAHTNYRAIRNIPHTPCACCGQTTILKKEITQAYKSVAKPLIKMIQEGRFGKWESCTEIFKMLNLWATEAPKSSFDEIISDDKKYTALKDLITVEINTSKDFETLSQSQKEHSITGMFEDIFTKSRSRLSGSAVVMKRFATFRDSLKSQKKEIFEQLQIYAQKYPRKTLSEIVQMENIYEFHYLKDQLERSEKCEKRRFHFNNIRNMVLKANPQIDPDELDLIQEATIKLCDERDFAARIPKAKAMYEGLLNRHGLEKLKTKVFLEVEQIPMDFVTKDSFFVHAKKSNFSDARIINYLLNPSISSFEHIVAQSRGGADDFGNGIVLCVDCNKKRGNQPYPEFIKYHPKMPYNTQKQIDYISNLIATGKTSGALRVWPIKVAETLIQSTNGIISPNIDKFCQKEVKRSRARLNEYIERSHQLEKDRITMFKEKASMNDKTAQIDQRIKEINQNIIEDHHGQSYEESLLKTLEDYIEKK